MKRGPRPDNGLLTIPEGELNPDIYRTDYLIDLCDSGCLCGRCLFIAKRAFRKVRRQYPEPKRNGK